MNDTYFTPGPSQLFPTIPSHLQKALRTNVLSMSHRGAAFQELYQTTNQLLKDLLGIPRNYHIFLLSSATEAMERIIENCVEKSSFHFVNGAFAQRFYETAKELKKNPLIEQTASGQGFDFQKIKIPNKTEVICLTQNETSTGVAIAPNEITKIKMKYPEKLLAVDIVSSAPYVQLDYAKLDLVFFSVQKGFGLPAGLGILLVSPKAMDKARFLEKKGRSIGSYHSFITLKKYADKYQTPETPNILGLYLFQQVLKDLQTIGITTIRRQTEEKANLLYSFFDTQKGYRPFVADKTLRSQTVIVVEVLKGTKHIIEKAKKAGIILGSGYGQYKDAHIRIGNFPSTTKSQVEKLLSLLK